MLRVSQCYEFGMATRQPYKKHTCKVMFNLLFWLFILLETLAYWLKQSVEYDFDSLICYKWSNQIGIIDMQCILVNQSNMYIYMVWAIHWKWFWLFILLEMIQLNWFCWHDLDFNKMEIGLPYTILMWS